MEETRICSKCSEEKPITEYYKNRGSRLTSCKACHNGYSKKYYWENKDERLAYYQEWRAENPEKMAASSRNWQINNKDKVNEASRRRDALKKSLTVEKVDYAKIRGRDTACYLCGETFTEEERQDTFVTHVDHIIPITRPELNPSHSYSNVALTHKTCNLAKKNLTPTEYWERIGELPRHIPNQPQ